VQSNCLSLEAIDTEYGRKTKIDQASCNLDTSCIKGDCPAFVTVVPGKGKRASKGGGSAVIPAPVLVVPKEGMVLRMPGIGGTGVVTVSQMLLTAAKIDGLNASAIDQTGLSQKAGPVVSTVTIGEPIAGRVHVLLGFDILTSVTPANIEGLDPQWSHVVASTSVTPTGRMIGKVSTSSVDLTPYETELSARSVGTLNVFLDAAKLTVGLLGSAITCNVLLLGVAFQKGLLPISAEAFERAIELNGTAIDANKAAFAWGRRWVVDPKGVEAIAFGSGEAPADRKGLEDLGSEELVDLVARRRRDLRAYQDAAYASRYVDVVRRAAVASRAANGAGSASGKDADEGFVLTVANQLFRVMAYKDEYEVARLLSTGNERAEWALGGPVESATWNLHPPTLRAMGMGSKLKMGPWTKPVMRTLAAGKKLRGTAMDPFGRAGMRKTERALIDEYTSLVDQLIPMAATNPTKAITIAGLMDQVRGFESVKERNLVKYRAALATALAE
jgi:indolepyruvate ferredoxin oxidoreductase